MATKWTKLNIDDEINENENLDGDEQELFSNTNDSEFYREESEEFEEEDKQDEIESKEESQKEKIQKIRKRPRSQRREKQLIQKLKEQEAFFTSQIKELKDQFVTKTADQNTDQKIAELNSKLNQAKQKLAKAKEENNYSAEADAQAELTQLAFDLRLIQATKQQISRQKETEYQDQENNNKTAVQNRQTPEAYDDWVESNEWFESPMTRDERKLRRYVIKKSQDLIEEGFEVDDDELYEELDVEIKKFVSKNKLNIDGIEIEEPDKKSKQSPTQPGRESFVTKTNGKTRIHLTSDEKSMADRLGVSYEDYARQKINAMKTGKTGYTNIF